MDLKNEHLNTGIIYKPSREDGNEEEIIDEKTEMLDIKNQSVYVGRQICTEEMQTDKEKKKEKTKIVKNMLVLCTVFTFLFTAFNGLVNLQSSINCDDGLGFASLACMYAFMIVSAVLLPSIAINTFGTKWTLVISMVFYVIYTAANYYPMWYILMTASAFLGIAAAPLWTCQAMYITTISIQYANINDEDWQNTVNRNVGIFSMTLKSSQIFGNILSSVVLGLSDDRNTTSFNDVTYTCGANDCQETEGNQTTFCDLPPQNLTTILLTLYVACGVIAIIITVIFLDKLKVGQEPKEQKQSCDLLLATIKLLKDDRIWFVIPMSVCSGIEMAVITGVFVKSYVSCVIGVNMVGYVMICYGVSNTVFCVIAGRVATYIGRVTLVAIGGAMLVSLSISLLLWEPRAEQMPVYFIIAAGWGLADAIWQTQMYSELK
uniref:Protein unc-93 homolog A-like n=1 Tax=Saccoglossus kowalevskii TaxID=10224 RepID=A0ABM0MXG8_SACKO|nr:PREDICTED: protein unc-93 homolog A-like [Saccoglossus kowalevskii]